MPLTRVVADALGVVTICLVIVLVLFGLFCVIYSFYFRNQIRYQALNQFTYFSGPWIIRILYILLCVWWGVGEIIRLNLLRRHGSVLNVFNNLKWQENVCKYYIVSNLGFAEPCLFLILIFLLHASLQRSGVLSHNWNAKMAGHVLLCCIPMFILQLIVILVGPKFRDKRMPKLPSYFVQAVSSSEDVGLCTYPLLSTLFFGLFATVLTTYLFWLGRKIIHLVINKGLKRRVCTLIFCVSSLLELRVVLLGLSVLLKPEKVAFDTVVFLAFLSLFCCAAMGICILVYLPIADSLVLKGLSRDDDMETN
ncbi:hypothetical protein ACS0TY_002300 [Phlomoides rotata]